MGIFRRLNTQEFKKLEVSRTQASGLPGNGQTDERGAVIVPAVADVHAVRAELDDHAAAVRGNVLAADPVAEESPAGFPVVSDHPLNEVTHRGDELPVGEQFLLLGPALVERVRSSRGPQLKLANLALLVGEGLVEPPIVPGVVEGVRVAVSQLLEGGRGRGEGEPVLPLDLIGTPEGAPEEALEPILRDPARTDLSKKLLGLGRRRRIRSPTSSLRYSWHRTPP